MQLFRVKDCKQMDKKKPIGFLLSARFHIYSIQYQNSFLYVMRWVVLLSLLASLAVLVCAVVLRDHTRLKHLVSAINTPFLGIITMRSFGGTIRWYCAPRFLGGGGLPLALRNAVLNYVPHHCCEGGNNPISYLGLALAIAVWNLIR